jgi:hypothetical protein
MSKPMPPTPILTSTPTAEKGLVAVSALATVGVAETWAIAAVADEIARTELEEDSVAAMGLSSSARRVCATRVGQREIR